MDNSYTFFCIIGSYALNNSLFDVVIMLVSGLLGFVFRKLEVPLGPFILALLLGPIAESNFRRSLALSSGDYSIFVTRPISIVLFILAIISLTYGSIKKSYEQKNNRSLMEIKIEI